MSDDLLFGRGRVVEPAGRLPQAATRLDPDSPLTGTEILVDGYQARDGSNRASGRDVTLADGTKVFLGGSAPPQ